MLDKNLIDELGSCIAKQFPDEGVYRISRVEEWLSTNGYSYEKLGVENFRDLIGQAPELFGVPRYNADSNVIIKNGNAAQSNSSEHPADSFFGSSNITLNDDIIEMSQQSLYALTKIMGWGLNVQDMKQEVYESFAAERDSHNLTFRDDKYIFRIGYCRDGYQVNGIVTRNISPRGKSLYFSFEKTNISKPESYDYEPRVHSFSESPEVSESDRAEIYKMLTSSFPFDTPQHMATISKFLADHHFDRSKYGYAKMKDILSQVNFLQLNEVILGGVPQTMVTIHRDPTLQASSYRPLYGGYSAPYGTYSAARSSYSSAYPTARTAPYSGVGDNYAAQGDDLIPSGGLEDFCNLPPKPIGILIQYLEKSGIRRDFIRLKEELCEDYAKAKAEQTIRTFEGKIIFPCRYRRTDGTPVELTLKPSSYEGKPWFLNFVDTTSRSHDRSMTEPGRRLENFAFLGSWSAFLAELAEKAQPENWDFADSRHNDYHILIQYIKYTFYRLIREDKVCISHDRQFACFNTGLFGKLYGVLYAVLYANEQPAVFAQKLSQFVVNFALGINV